MRGVNPEAGVVRRGLDLRDRGPGWTLDRQGQREWADSLGQTGGAVAVGQAGRVRDGDQSGVSRRAASYCDSHFLRDVAKPVLEADSHAKVQMRKKVSQPAEKSNKQCLSNTPPRRRKAFAEDDPEPTVTAVARPSNFYFLLKPTPRVPWCSIIARRCVAFSMTIKGGLSILPACEWPRHWMMSRASIQRNLDEKKGGSPKSNSTAWPTASTEVRTKSKPNRKKIREYVKDIAEVAATLEPGEETCARIAKRSSRELIDRFERTEDPIRLHMATVMISFLAGLFVGEGKFEEIKDNLDLERWFRLPKSHERRIHGHRHAGVRIVQEGPTLVLALDARLTLHSRAIQRRRAIALSHGPSTTLPT